ncbi:hypothetical protein Dip518_001453 [Parelusimicrobium proximum]|uniref:hypothetical protein n=1 Tax=Parelusimicrobium proximum TaxID=3228953 RepID=UPI003D1663EB
MKKSVFSLYALLLISLLISGCGMDLSSFIFEGRAKVDETLDLKKPGGLLSALGGSKTEEKIESTESVMLVDTNTLRRVANSIKNIEKSFDASVKQARDLYGPAAEREVRKEADAAIAQIVNLAKQSKKEEDFKKASDAVIKQRKEAINKILEKYKKI